MLQAFLSYETWALYSDSIDLSALKENSPEHFRLYQCVADLHSNKVHADYNVVDLQLAFSRLYPGTNQSLYQPLFAAIGGQLASPSEVSRYLQDLHNRTRSTALARAHLRIAEGTGTREELEAVYEKYKQAAQSEQPVQDWIDDDLENLYHTHYEKPGLRWALPSLNKALGSLRQGNFGFVFARPETGKTTFLASQLACMATQVSKPIWWFSNEQSGADVLTRCYQAVLGIDLPTLYSDIPGNRSRYLKLTRGMLRIVYDPLLSKSKIEQILKRDGAGLIIFDQIDPIQGFKADRDDLELTAIYEWARGLAGTYAPVIGVCQAGQSAEGKRWLTMNDVNNSKTGKQGAADYILGIGKAMDDGLETYRYFHLSKNKLQQDSDSDPALRHGKWEVRIKADSAQFEDI